MALNVLELTTVSGFEVGVTCIVVPVCDFAVTVVFANEIVLTPVCGFTMAGVVCAFTTVVAAV